VALVRTDVSEGVTSQKMAFFIVTDVKTSNLINSPKFTHTGMQRSAQ
jgi:hypothetical protein